MMITVLSKELLKRKDKYKHFDIKFESVNAIKKKADFEKILIFSKLPNIQRSAPFCSNFIFK